jgi:hypothetical protein
MSPRLNTNIVVHRLVADLGLRETESPVQAVVEYCHRRVRKFTADYGKCSSLPELLELCANKLGTRIIETYSDEDLASLQSQYVDRGEPIFGAMNQYLDGPEDYGVTIKLQKPEPWGEQPFVSVIDCRGRKTQRKYHTKWHELGHLFILTNQSRLAFRRSHDPAHPKSAEESLVDTIAGEMSFYPEIIKPTLKGRISFERVDEIRVTLCPEASLYSSILNLSKLWPTPCIWIEAQMAAKKSEVSNLQTSFGFRKPPRKDLRAIHSHTNEAARKLGISTVPRFRVPKDSIINQIHAQGLSFGEAYENMDWWESSDGHRLNECGIHVEAKRIGESIHAIIVPLTFWRN